MKRRFLSVAAVVLIMPWWLVGCGASSAEEPKPEKVQVLLVGPDGQAKITTGAVFGGPGGQTLIYVNVFSAPEAQKTSTSAKAP